jgi:prolipoprotein diacylglyceryltransferase
VELFREPDAPFVGPITMGQALSFPMFVVAAYFFWTVYKQRQARPA